MAVEIYCDYCGEEIEGRFATIKVGGIGDPINVESSTFQYHAEPVEDAYRACYELATRPLADMAQWAHRGEGPGLYWELHKRPRAVLAREPKMWATAPVQGELALDEAELHPRSALSLRRGGVRTLEEASERSEIELLALEGVSHLTVRQLAKALAEHELAFRPGPTPEQLGARIREARENAGLRRSDVARAIHTDGDDRFYESELAAWERGRRVPTKKRLERLAALFKIAPAKFAEAEVS